MDIVFLVSMFITIVIICVLIVLLNKKFHVDGKKAKYDERQVLARGRGYKVAFYTTVITSMIPAVLSDNIIRFLGPSMYFIPLSVGLMVYISYCIWNDAYLELNLNKKSWIIYMVMIGLFNIFLFLLHIKEGYVKDGVISISAVNLLMGIMCIVILIQIFIKDIVDKKREADDDEEFEA